VLKRERD